MSDAPQYPSYPGDQNPAGAPSYGQQPPAYGQFAPAPTPAVPYASWGARVGAYLLDMIFTTLVAIVPFVAGVVVFFTGSTNPVTDEWEPDNPALAVLLFLLAAGLGFLFDLYNRGIRTGSKGQSFGKKVVGISVIQAENGQFLGAGKGALRWLVSTLFGAVGCLQFIDCLWPLWDERKQTLHDKVMTSVAVRV
jgi:uncharacterized RDD family membrane protein YckC